MNPFIAKILASISEASYNPTREAFGPWQPHYVDEIKTYGFIVRVASNNEVIVVSFRGTDLAMKPLDRFFDSVGQMIANLDYSQLIVNDEFRIHRGYWRAISDIFDTLVTTLVKHGLEKKQVFVTGHSAGAAMATILAFLLHRNDIQTETYVYSSPRIGDSHFSSFFDASVYSNAVPLKRFEFGLDPIPILFPLSPSLAEYASTALDFLEQHLPLNLAMYKSSAVEYLHAAPLFFIDSETGELQSSVPLEDFLATRAADWLAEKVAELWPEIFGDLDNSNLPWTEVPKEILDAKRGVDAVFNIADCIRNGAIKEVFLHHQVEYFPTFLSRLDS